MTVTTDIPSAAAAQTIENTVRVDTTGGLVDRNPANNTDTEPTTLLPTGNLRVTKDDGVQFTAKKK